MIAHADREATSATPLIELTGVTKTYRTGELAVEVLHGIDLAIYPGEFVAIVGASGSGKSTLMNILGCLDRPTTGSYRFLGEDVSGLGRDELARLRREAFGFVFQSYNLIAGASATENVEVPAIYAGTAPGQRHERARALLTTLGLAERLEHKPNQLSGGQQQRVSIARALMNGGQIILADEPTGALDSKSGAEVLALLEDLSRQGHTVIVITHSAEVAAHAHRVIEIRDGQVVRDPGPQRDGRRALASETRRATRRARSSGWLEAAKAAGRALRSNLFRTALTLLGIVIGVASVIAMLAVGNGARQAVLDRISGMGTNLLLVRPATSSRGAAGGSTATMTPEDAEAIAALPNVLAAVPELGGTVTARYGNLDYQTQATSTGADFPLARNWPTARGTFFSPRDVRSYAPVVVLGQTVVEQRLPRRQRPHRQAHRAQQRPLPGDRRHERARRVADRAGPGRRRVRAVHHRQPAAVRAAVPAQHHGGGGRRRAHRRDRGGGHPAADEPPRTARTSRSATWPRSSTRRPRRRTRSRSCSARSPPSRCSWAASAS